MPSLFVLELLSGRWPIPDNIVSMQRRMIQNNSSLPTSISRGSRTCENVTFQALGSGIYWMVTVNVVVWMVAPLVAVTVRG
jgi:hypothetical protein